MKTKLINRLSSIVRPLMRQACGSRILRLHPKFRWLSYACPILNSAGRTVNRERGAVNPPPGPPKLRLRKRRRLSVRPTLNRER